MTVEEIFSKLSAHMIEGMMFHEQMANYYDFLNLKGYKRCHEYHYFCETICHRKLQRYFINHYNKLIPDIPLNTSSAIPSSWYKYTRQDVDTATKRKETGNGVTKWITWEKETKALYTEMYQALEEIQECSAAEMVLKLIEDVDREIKYAERKQLDLKAIDYDMSVIIPCQKKIHNKFERKLHCMKIDL